MIVQPALATAGFASPVHGYSPPVVAFRGESAGRVDALWWMVFVGLAYAAALAWASYCRSKGGSAEINFSISGFKVACTK